MELYSSIDNLYKEIKKHNKVHVYDCTVSKERGFKKHNVLLKSMYNNILKAQKAWRVYSKTMPDVVSNHTSSLPRLEKYEWIEKDIQTHIETYCKISNEYTFQLNQRKYTVYIVLEEIGPQECIKKVKSILKNTYILLHLLQNYAPINNIGAENTDDCSKEVNVFLYMSKLKKLVPDNYSHVLNYKNANSAFTTGCQRKTEICVFREEEWLKVLTHESFHNLGLDFIEISSSASQKANDKIKEIFPVNLTDMRLFETYCEMWGEIINNMLLLCHKKTRAYTKKVHSKQKTQKTPFDKWCTELCHCLNREAIFSCVQMNKVLAHQGLLYEDLFILEKAGTYKEDTQCFAYYVLKCILMVHYLSFFQFCENQAEPFSVDFTLSESNLLNYITLITSQYRSDRMLFYIKKTRESEHVQNSTTMRMSLHGN